MKKKILSLILSMLVMIPSIGVNAKINTKSTFNPKASIEKSEVHKQKFNEYDVFKSLKAKSDTELKNDGLNKEQIEKIRNFNYEDELIRRSKLDARTLTAMGYTLDEINQLKNFKRTEQEVRKLAPVKSVDTQPRSLGSTATGKIYSESSYFYNYGHDREIEFSWEWDKSPVFNNTDLIALGWRANNSEGVSLNSHLTRSNCTINYVNFYDNRTSSKSDSITPLGDGKASIKIPMINGRGTDNWVKSGWVQ